MCVCAFLGGHPPATGVDLRTCSFVARTLTPRLQIPSWVWPEARRASPVLSVARGGDARGGGGGGEYAGSSGPSRGLGNPALTAVLAVGRRATCSRIGSFSDPSRRTTTRAHWRGRFPGVGTKCTRSVAIGGADFLLWARSAYATCPNGEYRWWEGNLRSAKENSLYIGPRNSHARAVDVDIRCPLG